MINSILISVISIIGFVAFSNAQTKFESDTIPTDSGDLKLTFIGHGTLMFEFKGLVIHIDPVSQYADYAKMPKADIILVTHQHGDHLDPTSIKLIRKDDTALIYTETCAGQMAGGTVMKNGDVTTVKGIKIEAVPAYNLVHKRDSGQPFHPKGMGNGYVLTLGDKRVYIAGDTENIPEMKNLTNIDIAFLPMNLPYTMTPEMVAEAVRMFHPKILYPYHYGNTEVSKLIELLKGEPNLDIRVRQLQ
jgi:L-ascorbate metabolism protein UlaG (beta-lactamase superfamily)